MISTPRSSANALALGTEKQKLRLFRYSGPNLDRIRRNATNWLPNDSHRL